MVHTHKSSIRRRQSNTANVADGRHSLARGFCMWEQSMSFGARRKRQHLLGRKGQQFTHAWRPSWTIVRGVWSVPRR